MYVIILDNNPSQPGAVIGPYTSKEEADLHLTTNGFHEEEVQVWTRKKEGRSDIAYERVLNPPHPTL